MRLPTSRLLRARCRAARPGSAREPRRHGTWLGLLPGLALGTLLTGCADRQAALREPPTLVVLVVLDTLAAGHVSHQGYGRATTPRLDELARDGVTFLAAIAPAPYTVASIPSLLTGRLPDRHGLVDHGQRLRETEVTLAETLKAAGFATFAAVAVANGGPAYGLDQGFDEFELVYLGKGTGERETLEFHGRVVHRPTPEEIPPLVRARLARREQDEKLLLYLHFLQPHGPYDPPSSYRQRFRDARYPGPYREGERERAQRRIRAGRLDGPTKEAVIHLYDSNIAWADEHLGAVLDVLRERGLYDEALIVVTADHGEAFWQHGFLGHGDELYDESVRVPLVVKLPGALGPRGAGSAALVSTLDVLPSLCAWLGLPAPEGALDGRSLAALVGDPDRLEGHDALLLRASEASARIGMRTPDTKVIVQLGIDVDGTRVVERVELYDLASDPLEREDLSAARPRQAAALARQALERLAAIETDLPPVPGLLPEADARLLEALGYTRAQKD